MTEQWLETVSVLAARDLLDDANISAFGMSIGARFGLPVAVALGPRLRCAVFGKFGVRQTEARSPLPTSGYSPDPGGTPRPARTMRQHGRSSLATTPPPPA